MQLTPEQVQGINVLLSAVQVAQRRGAFSLQDAHTLQEAIDRLVPREEQERQAQASQDGEADDPPVEMASDVEPSEEVVEESDDSDVDSEPAGDSE